MTFRVARKNSEFNWPVEVQVPQDGGRYQAATFDARFLIVPQSEIDAAVDGSVDGGGNSDIALLSRVVIGWSGIEGEDGSPLPYSEDAKSTLLDVPYIRIALARAYFTALRGKERQRKN